jgi:hypothetical protein
MNGASLNVDRPTAVGSHMVEDDAPDEKSSRAFRPNSTAVKCMHLTFLLQIWVVPFEHAVAGIQDSTRPV